MKAIQIILSVLFLGSCADNNNKKRETGEVASQYPHIVDSLGVEKWYDDTKWYMYLYYCVDTPKIESNIRDSSILAQSYGSLDLNLDSLVVKNDSFFFYFDFFKGNDPKSINPVNYDGLNLGLNGRMYSKFNSDTTICTIYNHSSMFIKCVDYFKNVYDTTRNRYIKPLQPEVIDYLNKHQSELNPWFIAEAKKRGVIK